MMSPALSAVLQALIKLYLKSKIQLHQELTA